MLVWSRSGRAAVWSIAALLLGVLFFAIHVFRMAAFFLIAGFFARMMLEARGLGGFVRNRLVRIGVPLLVGWPIVMALIVALWIAAFAAAHPGVALKPPSAPAGHRPLLAFPLTHLWFLYVLLLLYALVIPIRCAFGRLDRSGRGRALADAIVAARTGCAPVSIPATAELTDCWASGKSVSGTAIHSKPSRATRTRSWPSSRGPRRAAGISVSAAAPRATRTKATATGAKPSNAIEISR